MLLQDNFGAFLPNTLESIFDIGAGHGGEMQQMRQFWKNCKIYAFEPDERNFPEIRYYGGIEPYKMVIGDHNGKANFYTSYPPKESGSIRKPKLHLVHYPQVKFNEPITVDMMTLDTFCENNKVDHIDFIWMDVQGAERDVFSGATTILKKTKYVYTECYDEEVYEGQYNRKQTLAMLPDFETVCADQCDILLKNKNF